MKDILKSRRIEMNLTQLDVAKAVGVSESTVSRWESGDIANMKRSRIAALANVLRISPSVIMDWDESQAPNELTGWNTEKEKTAPPFSDGTVDAVTKELLDIWEQGDDKDREDLLAIARILMAQRKKN